MNILYVTSGINKPFSFIDDCIIQAIKQCGYQLHILYPGKTMERGILSLKKKKQRPDFLLTMHGARLTSENLTTIRACSCPKAIWYTDDPYGIDCSLITASSFDVIFTNESAAVSVYKEKVKTDQVFHLPLATPASAIYSPIKNVSPPFSSDVVLVGTGFVNRVKFLKGVLPALPNVQTRLIGPGWGSFASLPKTQWYSRWVNPKEVCKYYNGAKIVLNLHRAHNDPYLKQNKQQILADTPNNRTFEIAATRSFQLMEQRKDLSFFYEPEKEIVTFSSPKECIEKIRFYLSRPLLRAKIANQAYQRTRNEHLYVHRIREIAKKMTGTS